MFVGVARGGALLLKVRERSVYEIAPPKSIEDDTGMIGTHFSTDPANYQRTRDFVENVATCLAEQNERIVALGTGNLSLCWASVGRLDGYLNWSVTPPYVLPGKIIFEAAQKPAKVTDGTGRPWAITARSVCASPHEKIARDLTSLTAKLGGAP
jgi:fructose-1,6-bisphosphatase/inositol monophosphatase family enzyme